MYLIFFSEFRDVDIQVQLHKMSTVLICKSNNQIFKLLHMCKQHSPLKASLCILVSAHTPVVHSEPLTPKSQ